MAKTTTTTQPRGKIWRASLWSDHFHFEAYGATSKEARAALLAGLKVHATQCGLPSGWWRAYSVDSEAYAIGQPYRDRSPLAVA